MKIETSEECFFMVVVALVVTGIVLLGYFITGCQMNQDNRFIRAGYHEEVITTTNLSHEHVWKK